jgi:ribonucleoside-diphosphate reductase alpha chain
MSNTKTNGHNSAGTYGPTLNISEEIHKMKYRGKNETFKEAMTRVADSLKDNEEHFNKFRGILYDMRFLPAGRVQSAMGAPRKVTPYNCFVSMTIPDSMEGIAKASGEAARTMQLGGGIGYDFSTLRPRGALIKSLESRSSGPVSFMGVFDAWCKTISSAGHRRGAQMGVLRVDHPDIEEFIRAKNNSNQLEQFNISVAVTDKFMEAVKADSDFDLVFDGRVYKTIRAKALWDDILRSTWDWAEPGILFIDRINQKNNLWYCETIASTNPCAEQPLPPHGACLLGSFNLSKYVEVRGLGVYVDAENDGSGKVAWFNYNQLIHDIPHVVRAMDNVVDRAMYPLPEQEKEAKDKRRMGLGVTGVANAIEALGFPYGSQAFLDEIEKIMTIIRDGCYRTSVSLAIEKGAFPLFDTRYLESSFAKTLPESIREDIRKYGIRNSHLLSVAPTGTISLTADNVSSGIEPVFSLFYDRTIQTFDGPRVERVEDYGYREFGVKGRTADSMSVFDHVKVLNLASKYVDSACSKTCNVGDKVTWDEFKDVYMKAYEGGASGCTTFRAAGKRYGILNAASSEEDAQVPTETTEAEADYVDEGGACYFNPETGLRTCE